MGNDFVHCELTTGDTGKANAFYSALFDWKIAPYPGMDYLGVDTGSKISGGGIQAPPMPGAPTGWMPYVAVKDVKASLEKAASLGANVVVPFTPVGDAGAIGVFVDPTGASLGVWEAAAKPAPKKKKAAPKKAAKKAAKKAKKKSRR